MLSCRLDSVVVPWRSAVVSALVKASGLPQKPAGESVKLSASAGTAKAEGSKDLREQKQDAVDARVFLIC
jgi:hypothetical protein